MEIPNFQAALDWERDHREMAFLGVVAPICGVPVQPLSLRRLGFLLQGKSAFFFNGVLDEVAVAQFLWLVSDRFKPGDLDARAIFIASETTIGALLELDAAGEAIREYLDAAFNDAPAAQAGPASGDDEPITCFAASLVHVIASEYGWSLDAILDAPLASLYQLMRKIALEYNPKALFISRRSRKAKGDWLRSLRACEAPAELPDASDQPLPPL